MKKNYMKPTTNVVNIRTQHQLLAGSLSGDYVKNGDASSDGENLSRGGSFWDDEED